MAKSKNNMKIKLLKNTRKKNNKIKGTNKKRKTSKIKGKKKHTIKSL